VHGRDDRDLIQIVDAALAEAARRSGSWLACRPGCTQCCLGPFPITQLDAQRLRTALSDLAARDPDRALRLRARVDAAVERALPIFPGDAAAGILDEDDPARENFFNSLEDEPCPVLDPESGLCDLYEARPLTCRLFGPPLRYGTESIGICELCFQGASDEQVVACKVDVDAGDLELGLNEELERRAGVRGQTTVAFGLKSNGGLAW
jgi:Fe-S-cluster containining protein